MTPSHQYPLGVTMSASRRLQLLEWARRSGAWVLEDDYDSEYRYAGRPLAALKSLDADHRVIYVGTLSKLMFPSLRLAYLVAPPQLADSFRRLRAALDDQPSMVAQPALAEFLARTLNISPLLAQCLLNRGFSEPAPIWKVGKPPTDTARSSDHFTSLAVTGVPSWKTAFFFSLKVADMSPMFMSSASSGLNLSLS